MVCVFTDDQVREVAPDLIAAMPRGSVLVLHTTGSPRTAESLAADAAAHGVDVVDAPVSGGPHDIAAGRVTLWVGGTDEALERARPALSAYGDPVLHVGPIGSGQKVKLVNNTLFAAQIGLVAEAARLGETPRHRRVGPAGRAATRQRREQGDGQHRPGRLDRRDSSAPSASSSGRTSPSSGQTVAELGADLGRLDDLVNAGLGT